MTNTIIPPGDAKSYTDRELLRSCLDAMRIAQTQSIPTDWRHMIAALEAHLAHEPGDELVTLALKLAEYDKNYGEDDPAMWGDLDLLGVLARAAVNRKGDA